MKKQIKKPGQIPSVVELQFPESEFSRLFKARMVELDRVKREHEDRWGVNKIIALVDVEFRIKVWKQAERVWEAARAEDCDRLASACDGMIRAYKALDKWATDEGIAPKGEVKAIEWEMDDGAVMAVVQTEADAAAYQKTRPDVQNRHIWSMQEIATMMAGGIGQDIARMKATIGVPATVVKVNASGFDDMDNDPIIDEPDTMPKMFNTKMQPLPKMD
jgi:hypothetical protein